MVQSTPVAIDSRLRPFIFKTLDLSMQVMVLEQPLLFLCKYNSFQRNLNRTTKTKKKQGKKGKKRNLMNCEVDKEPAATNTLLSPYGVTWTYNVRNNRRF